MRWRRYDLAIAARLSSYSEHVQQTSRAFVRGGQMNVGIILSCVDSDLLAMRIAVGEERLRALDPSVDVGAVTASLDAPEDGVRRRAGSRSKR